MRDYGQIIETVFVSSHHLSACIYLIIQRKISTWSFLGVKEQENFKKIFESSLKHKKTVKRYDSISISLSNHSNYKDGKKEMTIYGSRLLETNSSMQFI